MQGEDAPGGGSLKGLFRASPVPRGDRVTQGMRTAMQCIPDIGNSELAREILLEVLNEACFELLGRIGEGVCAKKDRGRTLRKLYTGTPVSRIRMHPTTTSSQAHNAWVAAGGHGQSRHGEA